MHFYRKEALSEEEQRYIKYLAYNSLVTTVDEKQLPVLSSFPALYSSNIFILSRQHMGGPDNFKSCGDGAVMYVSATDHYCILYDEELPESKIRWIVAKLLYFVECGIANESPNSFCRVYSDDMHTDAFAYQLTCPDVILKECQILTPEEIITYCRIPFEYAYNKARLLCRNESERIFHLLDDILLKNFRAFINSVLSLRR